MERTMRNRQQQSPTSTEPADQKGLSSTGSQLRQKIWPGKAKGAAFLLRLILGGIFVYSGGAKVFDPGAFQGEIANFDLVSWGLAGLVAVYLPWLELACGLALIAKWKERGSVAVLSCLMIIFIGFVASAWVRGLDVSCGCFGTSNTATSYPLWIARNLLILGGLIAISWLGRSTRDRREARTPATHAGNA